MKVDGHCHCGKTGFEAVIDPTALTKCHGTDYQTITGAAFRANNHRAAPEHFVLKSGAPESYIKCFDSDPCCRRLRSRTVPSIRHLRYHRGCRSHCLLQWDRLSCSPRDGLSKRLIRCSASTMPRSLARRYHDNA